MGHACGNRGIRGLRAYARGETRGRGGLLPVRRTAGTGKLPGQQLAGMHDVHDADHGRRHARRGSDPVQQTFLRLPLSAGHRRRVDGACREKTAPAGRCPFGERRRQAAARGEVRAALHDPLFHALVERAVLQETRSVLCRGYGFQGRNRALDVAHEPYAAALGRLRGKDVLVQIHLSAGSCQQHFQIHAAVRDRRPRRLGARCAGRCERVGLDDRRRMSCRLYRRDRQDAQLHLPPDVHQAGFEHLQ